MMVDWTYGVRSRVGLKKCQLYELEECFVGSEENNVSI